MDGQHMQTTVRKQASDLQERLVDFSSMVIDVIELLPDTRIANHIAGQLLRCGTAAGPNYGEAQSAESRRDFVHKMKVGLKELRETLVWLKVIRRKLLVGDTALLERAIAENNELIAIFVSSVVTAQRNMERE